jgi:hypothetical protein
LLRRSLDLSPHPDNSLMMQIARNIVIGLHHGPASRYIACDRRPSRSERAASARHQSRN